MQRLKNDQMAICSIWAFAGLGLTALTILDHVEALSSDPAEWRAPAWILLMLSLILHFLAGVCWSVALYQYERLQKSFP